MKDLWGKGVGCHNEGRTTDEKKFATKQGLKKKMRGETEEKGGMLTEKGNFGTRR